MPTTLLETCEIMNAEQDIALMPTAEDDYKRADSFDYRYVKIHGDMAYAVYLLKSVIIDKKNGTRNPEWLESAILRRVRKRWLVAVLHSTRITKSASWFFLTAFAYDSTCLRINIRTRRTALGIRET